MSITLSAEDCKKDLYRFSNKKVAVNKKTHDRNQAPRTFRSHSELRRRGMWAFLGPQDVLDLV